MVHFLLYFNMKTFKSFILLSFLHIHCKIQTLESSNHPRHTRTHTHVLSPIPKHLNSAGEKHSVRLHSLYLFIYCFYFLLHWAFIAVCRLSLIAGSEGYSPLAVHELLFEVASLAAEHGP